MKDFKEIAEKCLAGELSGTFKNRQGDSIPSHILHRFDHVTYPYFYWDKCITIHGNYFHSGKSSNYDIIDFIPDNMQNQITIDIPEGMEVIREDTSDEIKIKFIKKSLSYDDIENQLSLCTKIQTQYFWTSNVNECYFSKKIEVLRKLTNIRNYFGKPDPKEVLSVGWCISSNLSVTSAMPAGFGNVVFLKKEHAEQAIKMLGDELKYLFEPW